jgi:flagellar basal-body rod protein FlgB
MTTENISLFKAISAKMDYLNQRQKVISQNIANADTPNYRPLDVKDADFRKTLGSILQEDSKSVTPVSLETTNALHMPPANEPPKGQEGKQKKVYEVAPVGNAIIMEEQLLSSNKTMADYSLMTSLYQKNISMIKMALGR